MKKLHYKETYLPFEHSGLSVKEVSKQLNLSASNVRIYLQKFKIKLRVPKEKQIVDPNATKVCTGCLKILPRSAYYANGLNKVHPKCPTCLNTEIVTRQQNNKQAFIDYKGGKCLHCGYCKSPSALQFHHVDPTQKDFELSRAKLGKFDETVKAELDKCILLCANCHAGEHDQIYANKLREESESN